MTATIITPTVFKLIHTVRTEGEGPKRSAACSALVDLAFYGYGREASAAIRFLEGRIGGTIRLINGPNSGK